MVCKNTNKKNANGSSGCGHKNVRFESFMFLSLPISSKCKTLDDCLDLFCTEEKLDHQNKWYCSKCKEHVEATKKFDIWALPPILIVHLKRFEYSKDGSRQKLMQSVDYPFEHWDIPMNAKRKKLNSCYNLYAISNHHGNLASGHYTAHAKNRYNENWYEFNDSRCTQVDVESLVNMPSAYCLFYNRIQECDGGKANGPKVRFQSITRPELWPHMQCSESLRNFAIESNRNLKVENEDGIKD